MQPEAEPSIVSGLTAAKWSRIQELFYAAAELPATERSGFLATACPDSPSLRFQVANLLDAIEEDGVITRRVQLGAESVLGASEPVAGERIGSYEIVRPLGRGGMGTVYLATRADDQFRKQVAIKTMRFVDSPELLDRFRAERQILANMEHPNIARLLDGGVTSSGLPYLVMDFVEGEPITAYCERLSLGIRDRLHLFQQVCSAVQYAHTNLVIHRDLKPENIYVAAGGTPKLLDFGIAKLLDRAQDQSGNGLTVAGERLMTPAYASPEQMRGEAVSTATDVYSLGVVLYELLTGVLPFRLQGTTASEAELIVCRQEPPKPSAAQSESLAKPVRRALSGDLDNIVLMALRKDPSRRYQSVWHLMEEIDRHLNGYPVQARPDQWSYRTRKFAARHRLGVAGGLISILAVTVFVAALIRERDASDRERRKAEEVSRLMRDLFRVSDPSEARGQTVTAREVMDRGVARIERELSLQPDLQTTMLQTIADVYRQLGLYPRSLELVQQSLELRRKFFPPDDPGTIRLRVSLGQIAANMGKYRESEMRLREALSLMTARRDLDPALQAEAWNSLGLSLARLNRPAEAEAAHLEAVKIYRKRFGPEAAQVGEALSALAETVRERGDARRAEPYYREAVRILAATRGTTDPAYGSAILGLAGNLARVGRAPEAEPLFMEALALHRKLYGEAHVQTANVLNDLASMYGEDRLRGDDAVATHRKALAAFRAALGEEHPYVATSMGNLAVNLERTGHYDEAEEIAQQALRMNRKLLGDDSSSVNINLSLLAALARDRGDYEAAERAYRDVLARRLKPSSPNPLLVANARFSLGTALGALGRFSEAEALLDAALAEYRNSLSKNARAIPDLLIGLGDCRSMAGKAEAAERAGREAVAAARGIQGDVGAAVSAQALACLGRVLQNAGKSREAVELLRQWQALPQSKPPEQVKQLGKNMYYALTVSALGRALADRHEFAEARKLLEESALLLRPQTHAYARAEFQRNRAARAVREARGAAVP